MEYKMHRAIKISTGEVLEVSDVLANDPKLLSDYGVMLQPLPEEDITNELKAKFEEGEKVEFTAIDANGIKSDLTIEKTKDGIEVYPTIDMFPIKEPSISVANTEEKTVSPLQTPELIKAATELQKAIVNSKPKNKQTK